MTERVFKGLVAALGAGFAALFAAICIPPLIRQPDIVGAFAAGFVNPFASGYALDAIFCWGVLAVWVVYERSRLHVRHGWMALALGVAPGVATGFAVYLLMRHTQLRQSAGSTGT